MVRAVFLVLFALLQMVTAFRPDLFGIDGDIGSMARANRTNLVPAGYAFAIWTLLYAGGLYIAFWHWRGRNEPRIARVGLFALGAFLGNTVWALHQPVFGPGLVSLLLLQPIMVFSFLGAWESKGEKVALIADRLAYGALWALSGWITVATAAGLSIALKLGGLWPLLGSEESSAVLLLAFWGVVALFLSYRAGRWAYAMPMVWGLLAIAAANGASGMVSYAAFAASALIIVAAFAGKKSDRTAT